MNSLVHAPLGEVAKLNPTFKAKAASPDELVDFLPMSAVSAELTTVRATEQRQLCEVQKGYTNFADGDVLLAKITPCFENGKIAFVNLNTAHGFGSTEFHVIRANRERLDGRYLVHFLRRNEIRLDGARNMTGSAGQRRVPKHYLESLSVPLPTVPNQRRIAAILDQADTLRAKRREALAQLDSLTQSIFIEMFGDPVGNPNGWATQSLQGICDAINDCPHTTPDWTDSGLICLRTSNLSVGGWNWADTRFVSESAFHDRSKRGYLSAGDLVLSREGTVGIAAIVQEGMQLCMGQRLVQLRPNSKILAAEYLLRQLLYVLAPLRISQMMVGSTSQHLNVKELRALRIPLPPLYLQQTFAVRIQSVEALKVTHRAALQELDRLFASLQHRAFQGEL